MGKALDLDDLTSLLDQLLLISTLMLGFTIANMTGSSLAKADYIERDAWAMGFGAHLESFDPMNPAATDGYSMQSYPVILYGQLSVGCFFISIGFAISTYIALNLSYAREDADIFSAWSKFFLPFVYLGWAFNIGGIIFFFLNYDAIVGIIFPLYCTLSFSPDDKDLAEVYDRRTLTMAEIPAGKWDMCKDRSFTHVFSQVTFITCLAVFGVTLVVSLVMNISAHVRAEAIEVCAVEAQRDLIVLFEQSLPGIDHKKLRKYARRCADEDVDSDLFPELSYEQLRELGWTVGHAQLARKNEKAMTEASKTISRSRRPLALQDA